MDHERNLTVQEHLPDMLDKLDHRVGVLGHTMVWPSSKEKVLQFEWLGGWVTSLVSSHQYFLHLDCTQAKDMTGGVSLCLPHECQLCGAILRVNHLGTYSLHCGKSMGCHPCHTTVNDLIKRSLASTKISAHLEPVGICQADGRRPDGASVMPWRSGRVLVWDATCPDTFAPSHLQFADMEAGAVADLAERRKRVKYTELATDHYFIPVAIKNTGVFGPEAFGFFQDIGHHIREESGESCTLLPLPH